MTFHVLMTLSPTCQVTVVRFYVRGPSSSFLLLRRASTASARSQGSPPDPNSKLRIRVTPTGPERQAQDQSDPPRTSTASAGSQCSVPELNSNLWGRAIPAGPQLQASSIEQTLDRSVPRRTRTATSGSK